MKNIIVLLSILICSNALAQEIKISGLIQNEQNKPLFGTTIGIANKKVKSNENGNYSITTTVGKQSITFSCIGYQPVTKTYNIQKDTSINIILLKQSINIDEVFVTARESKNLQTSSIITKDAMQLLQPSSFADLLELLPGGRAQDPSLTSFNRIKLREVNLKGKSLTSEKYDMSSLGVSFYMDGAPINTNSDLQSVNGYTTSTKNPAVENTNKGLDLRTLGTDDIEKVTIIRGIPSVEYGDLTSGLVLIERKKGESEYTFRAKTDGFGKLFSLSKGYTLKNNLLINTDLGYIKAQSNPTNNFLNFSRLTGSIRFDKTWKKKNTYNFQSNLDYNTTLDNNKTDPDNSYVADSYYGRKQRFSVNNILTSTFNTKWIKDLQFVSNLSLQKDIIEEDKWIQARTATILINSLEQGSHEAQFLTPSYLSHLYVEGLPFTAYHKIKTQHLLHFNKVKNTIKLGVESNYSKNYGEGQVYNLNYPTNTEITARPRAFREIPAYHTISTFAENNISWPIHNFTLDAEFGIRAFSITSLNSNYEMSDKIYAEPRTNVKLHLPKFMVYNKPMHIKIGGGVGIHKKTPTLDHLYPNLQYRDIVELNFFHNNPDYRIAQAHTEITNPVNYNIKPATNKKFELNADLSYEGNSLFFTFFKERMNDAFRPNNQYKSINYTKYDNTSLDLNTITKRPSALDFANKPAEEFYYFSQTENGSEIFKDGIEFQLSTRRFRGINTRFTVDGAWYKNIYKNSLSIWKLDTDIIYNGANRQIAALYADDDGYLRETFNTNLTVDSYLPSIGLNLSASFQALWYYKSQSMPKNGMPISYKFVNDNIELPFNESSLNDAVLKQLVNTYNPTLFVANKEPLDLQVNLKVSKKFKEHFKASVFANRLFLYRPTYTTTLGNTVSRSLDAPYFGMELTFTL